MNSMFRTVSIIVLGQFLLASAFAQRQLQDSFWLEHSWSTGFSLGAAGQVGFGLAVDSSQRVYIANGSQIVVFTTDGTLLQTWPIASVRDVAIHPTSNLVYVCTAATTSNQIKILDFNGNLIRQWSTNGVANGQVKSPQGIAVSANGEVYIADYSNNRVQVFGSDGTFLRTWGQFGTATGDFKGPCDIGIGPDNTVYVADYSNNRIQRFDSTGNFLGQYSGLATSWNPKTVTLSVDKLVYGARDASSPVPRILSSELEQLYQLSFYGTTQYPDTTTVYLHGAAFSPDGQLLYLLTDKEVRVLRRGYRTMGLLTPNALPLPIISNAAQRAGTTLVDIDYQVLDPDDSNVTVTAAAFLDGRRDLRAIVPMRTFEEGTASALGTNIPTGQYHRLTWNVGADFSTNFFNVKIDVLAMDNRGLVDFHFLTIPSNTTYNTELKISRTPLQQDDFLGVWTWLIANGSSDILLQTGDVYGVSGAYSNVLLAQTISQTNTVTTTQGRAYLFSLLQVREASTDEVYRAKIATTPGVVTRWDPRNRIGDLPQKINEYGFDTGLFSTNPVLQVINAWWVVPLP